MSIPRPRAVASAAAVALLAGVSLIWICPDADPDPAPLEETDLEAPMAAPASWSQTDADSGNHLDVDLQAGPAWRTDNDNVLLRGPTIDGADIQWEQNRHDDWHVAVGTGETAGADLEIRIWTAPGWPAVVIDVDARLSGPATADGLDVTTSVESDDARFVTGGLDHRELDDELEDVDVAAGRFDTPGPTLQLHSPDGATGSVQTDGAETSVDWRLAAPVDGLDDCLQDREPTRTVSSRLVVGVGDHPTVAPMAAPVDARELSTPIFVDAPADSGDFWVDGRAEDDTDLARRYRALALGHSDPDDPRYGNGGLLAAGMGGLFVVPPAWTDTPAIDEVRDSLRDSAIEVLGGDETDGSQIADPDDCDAIVDGLTDGDSTTVVRRPVGDPAYNTTVTTPLPPVLQAGQLPTRRDTVLDRLFDTGGADGDHRIEFAPLVATRNPLEEISQHNILSPDRNGHWTLHDELTRRFSRLELERDVDGHHTTGLEALRDHRRIHRTALPSWAPDGMLEHPREEAEHLLFFGDLEQLDIDVPTSSQPVTWRYDPTSLPVFNGDVSPTTIEFQ